MSEHSFKHFQSNRETCRYLNRWNLWAHLWTHFRIPWLRNTQFWNHVPKSWYSEMCSQISIILKMIPWRRHYEYSKPENTISENHEFGNLFVEALFQICGAWKTHALNIRNLTTLFLNIMTLDKYVLTSISVYSENGRACFDINFRIFGKWQGLFWHQFPYIRKMAGPFSEHVFPTGKSQL
jgi:hypothetical protein